MDSFRALMYSHTHDHTQSPTVTYGSDVPTVEMALTLSHTQRIRHAAVKVGWRFLLLDLHKILFVCLTILNFFDCSTDLYELVNAEITFSHSTHQMFSDKSRVAFF